VAGSGLASQSLPSWNQIMEWLREVQRAGGSLSRLMHEELASEHRRTA
jgi:hypothetical protein